MGISLVSYYHIVQFHSLFIGKGFGIENSYINLHDYDVKFIAFRCTNENPIELKYFHGLFKYFMGFSWIYRY